MLFTVFMFLVQYLASVVVVNLESDFMHMVRYLHYSK